MMDTTKSCVPPGFRFHPTDEELVGYYLRKKIASQKIDLDVIREIDLYRIEPWDLIERCRTGYEEQKEWYFFSHNDKKYPIGTRTNRATIAGFWKATGRDKVVFDKCKLIGMRKTLVFYKGRAPNGQKTDWIMHEYRLESDTKTPQEAGWVVCRAFKKRATSQTKNRETWNSTSLYDHSNSVKSLGDTLPFNYIKRHDVDHDQQEPSSFLNHNLMCKQEADQSENNIRQFVQPPQLQSPSLPSLKRPSFCNNHEEQHQQHMAPKRCRTSSINDYTNNKMASTDWRHLDKFVASQLSQEEERSYDHHRAEGKYGNMLNFGGYCYSPDHMELLLSSSHEYREDGNKLHELLNSESSCDIGIHIFDK